MIQAIQANPLDFDKILVDYETGLLANEIVTALSSQYPTITLPDDYSNKSVTMQWITQNNQGVETSITHLFIEINF